MHDEAFDLGEAVALLERAPATLSALLAGLPARWAQATEGEGEWSPAEIVGHLIHGEQTNWLPRARHILAGDGSPFPPFDRAGFADERPDPSLAELLARFAELRRANLAALAELRLTPADLGRTGLHPEFGEVRLGQLLATWAVHDLNHLRQIVRTLAKVYGEAIGPWRAYLPIVHDRE